MSMNIRRLESYVSGRWHRTGDNDSARTLVSAIDGTAVASLGADVSDFGAVLAHAKTIGGPALREMTFHQRAKMLKALALHLKDNVDELYALSHLTGATLADSKVDIDGGIGTMLVFASKGRSEMPDGRVYIDGAVEQLSRGGSFVGQHICTPLKGAAIHINAFNFPVWGMLEKLAPTLLAGVPAIVKPASVSCYVTEACVRLMIGSGLLPNGALQLILGGTGDLLDRLTFEDVVSFTGSAATAQLLRNRPNVLASGARFIAEQDSLNGSLLAPDVTPSSADFELFVKEAAREITTKAGQKCTAIRRIIAPADALPALIDALGARLAKASIGDPRDGSTRMGALVSEGQRQDVLEKLAALKTEATVVATGAPVPENLSGGAFLSPTLLRCDDPMNARTVHEVEAFGPVATVMPYEDLDQGLALLNRGGGSLVASVVTRDPDIALQVVETSASFHGRLYFNNQDSAGEATGHGAPLPHMVHGGPGRAGGGEELGGVRGVMHYMQRTAIQASPALLTGITGRFVPGAPTQQTTAHPFRQAFHELKIGDSLSAGPRTISIEDIETFAHFTGDTFYAHMDEEAAKANPFFPGRVAHGYLLLSFAAGLFVDPAPGPVLANTGLENLAFLKPFSPGDALSVRLTVKRKTPRTASYGEIAWHVELSNQDGDPVATYTLLTMNAYVRG